jgi:hypothetical protein
MKNQQEFKESLNPKVRTILDKMSHFEVDEEHLDLQGISDYIEALFQELNTEDLGDLVADAVTYKVFSQKQGNKFLNVSVWGGQTNGAELHTTLEKWLEQGNDPVRIELALAQSTFPFLTKEKMSDVLRIIAKRYPQFANTVNEMIDRREAQGV